MSAAVRTPQQGDTRFSPHHPRSQAPHGRDPCRRGASRKSQRRSLSADKRVSSYSPISASNLPSFLNRSSSSAATCSSSASSSSTLAASSSLPQSSSFPHLFSPNPKASLTEGDLEFPAYNCDSPAADSTPTAHSPSSPCSSQLGNQTPESQWRSRLTNMSLMAGDDNAVEREPTQQVDYLTHDWNEQDIWTTWRYITSRRNIYANSVRLENAAWRSWTKLRCGLGTLPPESLRWHKDRDLTWLYGPLLTHSNTSSPPCHSKSNSFLNKKSILKKRTASQTICQRSLSTRTLLKQAGDIVKSHSLGISGQRPGPDTSSSDFIVSQSEAAQALQASVDSVSSNHSDTQSSDGGRHISFNTEVAQFIAVDNDNADYMYPDHDTDFASYDAGFFADNDSSSEDSLVMKGPSTPSRQTVSLRSTPRSSFSSGTIALLPPTTLNFHSDTPEPELEPESDDYKDDDDEIVGTGYSWWGSRSTLRLPRSSSVETLRPTIESETRGNVLLGDEGMEEEDPDSDLDLQSKWVFENNASSFDASWFPAIRAQIPLRGTYDADAEDQNPYPSSSGVFVPFGYEDEGVAETDAESEAMIRRYGIFGKVMNTVNTAKDIAHVIWNVGWGN